MASRKLQEGEVLLIFSDEGEVREEMVLGAGDPERSKLLVSLIERISHRVARSSFPALVSAYANALEGAFETAMEDPSGNLTHTEAEVLAGYEVAGERSVAEAVLESLLARQRLLEKSLTAKEAAAILQVNPSRIRQRLDEGTLWGFKHEGEWRLPDWQFSQGALVPGMPGVNLALGKDHDPLVVEGFLFSPSPDLVLDGIEVTPLQWLQATSDPEPVALAAASL